MPKRRILRKLRLMKSAELISPAQEGARVTIMKREQEPNDE